MEDGNSIHSENSVDTIDNSTPTTNHYLSVFIKTWETYPELWNTSCKAHRDKVRRNNALDKLLDIYKNIKPNSTREDVKKKLNSLRTNFRKELKKIHQSQSSGMGTNDIYVPSAWTYYELLFLSNDEQPLKKTTERDKQNDTEQHTISSMDPPPTPVSGRSKRKKDNDQQNCSQRTLSLSEKDTSEHKEEYHLAKVWAAKLSKLEYTQKLLAEKAINDILFEAQLGKLTKNSVQVNEDVD